MIYNQSELSATLREILAHPETELVEFKEARTNYDFNSIGQYFSALSNEANLYGRREAWLIFGVADDMSVVGTNYRNDEKSLRNLKKEIRALTNQSLTFVEIYTLNISRKRVVMFQIPPATPGIPTTWKDMAYARVGDALEPLPLHKMDEIRRQTGYDWSKEIVEGASMDDLDPAAVKRARELFVQREVNRGKYPGYFDGLDDVSLLNKAGVLLGGKITRTALILLGNEYAKNFFDGFIPRITWSLYGSNNMVKTYEHFDTPFLLTVDEVYKRIRNIKYRYIAGSQTLFPEEVDMYSPELVKELLHNAIAHQDYSLRGKINVEEFEDYLIVMNEGRFIPETIERALEPGYKPPYYRNAFLCNAMANLYMIDSNAIGVPTMFEIQRSRYFPLPSYDLSEPNRVKVTVHGKILDQNYTRLLNANRDLDVMTVFLLDKIQKKETILQDDYQRLRKNGLAEGRYPNIHVSFSVAEAVGRPETYVWNAGIGDEKCKMLIIRYLEEVEEAKLKDIFAVVSDVLPKILSEEQKKKKISYLLQTMKKRDKTIDSRKNTSNAVWFLKDIQ
ncbi:MAG: putative DNA binding domain-containing protein [Thermoguttaceae bacterium]|nr:putative DNA binding domain-containing protein [Thermoguttaceae bacterium]